MGSSALLGALQSPACRVELGSFASHGISMEARTGLGPPGALLGTKLFWPQFWQEGERDSCQRVRGRVGSCSEQALSERLVRMPVPDPADRVLIELEAEVDVVPSGAGAIALAAGGGRDTR
jgi:hypothetical protein